MEKEHVIGIVLGLIISVVGGMLSLNVQSIKDGVCGGVSGSAPSAQASPSAK